MFADVAFPFGVRHDSGDPQCATAGSIPRKGLSCCCCCCCCCLLLLLLVVDEGDGATLALYMGVAGDAEHFAAMCLALAMIAALDVPIIAGWLPLAFMETSLKAGGEDE